MGSSSQIASVLGADGMVGAAVVRQLSGGPNQIRAGCDGRGDQWRLEDMQCQWQRVDRDRPATIRRLVRGAQTVIECGPSAFRECATVADAKRCALRQLRVVLDACLTEGVGRVMYVSSAVTAFETGSDETSIDEGCRYVPGTISDPYVEAMAAMEAEVYRYVAAGLDVVLCLPTVVFGAAPWTSAPPALIRAIVTGKHGRGCPEGLLNIVDVRDVARAIMRARRRGRRGRRYLLGGTDIECQNLVELIAERSRQWRAHPGQSGAGLSAMESIRSLFARWCERRCGPAGWHGFPNHWTVQNGPISSQRACGELDFRPRELASTIDDMIEWLVRVGALNWTDGRRRFFTRSDHRRPSLDPGRSFC